MAASCSPLFALSLLNWTSEHQLWDQFCCSFCWWTPGAEPGPPIAERLRGDPVPHLHPRSNSKRCTAERGIQWLLGWRRFWCLMSTWTQCVNVWSSTAVWTRTSIICLDSRRPRCSRGTATPGPSYGVVSAASCWDKRSLTRAHTGCVSSLLFICTLYLSLCHFHLFALPLFYAQCVPLHVCTICPSVILLMQSWLLFLSDSCIDSEEQRQWCSAK